VEVGRHLFYDRRLSGNGTIACATCHRQELAFTDGRARAVGATGQIHPRSSMALVNVAYNESFTWADPGTTTLEDQAVVPLLNEHPIEMGMAGRQEEILDRFRREPWYRERFRRIFPEAGAEPIRLETVARALAAFERTLLSGNAPYDRLLHHDEADALSADARRGMALFFSEELACGSCHGGFNFSGGFHNTALYDETAGGRSGFYPATDQGLHGKTRRRRDLGRFRAPTLRNIAVTAPYMHDGSIPTLEAVLDHYAAGGRAPTNPRKSPLLRGFTLSAAEKGDLLAFLASLTDRDFLTDPRFSNPFDSP
jgi:cytochrome c peroxidase